MRRALKLAAKGAGRVSPNPMVGVVIVRDGKIIGEGYHQKFGEAHAEVNAIADAGGDVAGATLYSTLEPCCHLNKKTPPCAQRIIKEKISRVVIAGTDPNPHVNGKGVIMMRKAGILVETGLLEAQNSELNRFFINIVTRGLPWVMVKIAQTLDGRISRAAGRQTWITGEKAQRQVHKWRAQYDAVLVGAGTVRSDDPQLTVRQYRGRNPMRIILSHTLNIPVNAGIISGKNKTGTVIFTTSVESIQEYKRLKNSGVWIQQIAKGPEGLTQMLQMLAAHGIASLMVEGGQQVFTQFISAGLADQVCVFVSPKIFGSGPGVFDADATDGLAGFQLHSCKKIGPDVLISYRRSKKQA